MSIKSFPPATPAQMYSLRNQTVHQYADDSFTNTRYTFNGLGYRSDYEFELTNDVVIVFGNTLTFGLGLDIEQTFIGILSKKIPFPIYNFSWGRYGHENSEQLELLKNILSLITPKLIIFQINDLNRHRINNTVSFNNPQELIVEKFNKFYTELKRTVGTIPHILLHWDYEDHGVDVPDCLIHNKYHVDSIDFYINSVQRSVMGVMSHKIISAKILKEINEKSIFDAG